MGVTDENIYILVTLKAGEGSFYLALLGKSSIITFNRLKPKRIQRVEVRFLSVLSHIKVSLQEKRCAIMTYLGQP